MTAEATLSRLAPFLETAGITRVANVTGLDHVGIPVALVVRPNSRSLSVAQGKGVDWATAAVSGVMESLEQYHAERIQRPVTLATLSDHARRHCVADVHRLPRTPKPLCDHARLLWIEAKELGTGASVEVPFELVHLDMTEPLPQGSGYFSLGSNGLASGNTLNDAIAHGLWEVVERDALALFYLMPPEEQADRRLRLRSVDDAACVELLERFARADVGVAIWDMTSDLGVATFLASIGENELDLLRRIGTARGYGCHPDRGVALRRALTEAAQSRLTRIAGSRDDIQREDLTAIRAPESISRQQAHVAQEPMARRRFQDVPTRACASAGDGLAWTCARLSESGFDRVLYVDLSSDEFPISVARTIVVGLEGFPEAPTYVPGARARMLLPESGGAAPSQRASA